MTISTQRLLLRPFQRADLDALIPIFSDPDVMRYWDRPAHGSAAQTQEMLDQFMRHAPDAHLEYAVELQGRLIGRVGMWRRFEVGYIFAPQTWGQGFATEALRALIADIWARFPDAPNLTAELDPRNIGSARVLEKLGFAHLRTEEKNFLYGDTEWCDTAYYELPRPAPDTPIAWQS